MSGANSVALTGLLNSSNALNGVANNIANAETVGFKKKTSSFANLVGGSQFGSGTTIADVRTDFTQGGRKTSGRVLDMMIDGNGYFMVSAQGSQQTTYTRNGEFSLDDQGNLVNIQGLRVQGFQQNASGQYPLNPTDIQIPRNFNTPQVTSTVNADINLMAGGSNFSTSVSVYDSLGAENTADISFSPTGTANQWDVSYTIDGATYGPNTVDFTPTGTIVGAPVHTVNIPGFANGAAAQAVDFDLSAMTQFDGSNKVNGLVSDGYGIGSLEGIEVSGDGIINARYSNGQSLQDYRIGLVTFPNEDGLSDVGQGNFVAGVDAGARSLSFAGQNGLGNVVSSALEGSNVDLTTELVDLIQYQKAYRANAKTITTSNQLTETTLNLDR
tara:strand:+ start:113159 stop:114313 length:1155 start_codon:yes stop_codon:yes gene_type:complete